MQRAAAPPVTQRHTAQAKAADGAGRPAANPPGNAVIAGLEPIDSYVAWLALFSLIFGYEGGQHP